MGLPPLSPMVDIWGRNVTDQKVPPAQHDRQLRHWSRWRSLIFFEVLPPHPRLEPLKFSSEINHEATILGWEAQCEQNTAAILLLEAPDTIKHYVFFQLILMIYNVSEAFNRDTFEATQIGFGLPKACQRPTWSPDMKQDCVKTMGPITTVNATTFFSNHWIPLARAEIPISRTSRLRHNISTFRPGLAECANLLK